MSDPAHLGPAAPVEGRTGASFAAVYAEQRRRLLAGLAEAMAERAYAATSVADVLVTSGISRPTFYNHFADVGECFEAAHKAALAELLDRVETACAHAALWPACAGTALDAALSFLAADPPRASLLLVEPPAAGYAAIARHDAAIARLAAGLPDVRANEAVMRAGEAVLGAVCFVLARRLRAGEATDLPALAPELADLLLAAFPREGGGAN